MKRILAVLAASLAVACTTAAAPVQASAPNPAKIAAFGDSLSETGVWEADLTNYMAQAGVTAQFSINAHGGWRCSDWLTIDSGQTVSRLRLVVAAFQPDITIIECGTNDAANNACCSAMTSVYSALITEALTGYSPTRVLTSWIQYSATHSPVNPSLPQAEANVNDAIYTSVIGSVHGTRIVGPGSPLPADLQGIPEQYLDSGGIHPTSAGYEAMARIFFLALKADPTYSTWFNSFVPPTLCGMTGHRPGIAIQPYTVCNTLAGA